LERHLNNLYEQLHLVMLLLLLLSDTRMWFSPLLFRQ
jgi:hypothetical protein